jgi:hypothetical protein
VQISLAPRANQKLAFKFFGPFQVLKRIGSVTYKLALPAGSSIHLVFHVSQLKKVVGSVLLVTPLVHPELTELQVPDRILQRRMVTRGLDTVSQVLVQWSGSPSSLATWEDSEALRQRFPGALAWGQASAYGGGDVRTGQLLVGETEQSLVGDNLIQSTMGRSQVNPRRRKPNSRVISPQWMNV